MSEAADIAEVTLWELGQYLVNLGYKSSYSVDDLDEEAKISV